MGVGWEEGLWETLFNHVCGSCVDWVMEGRDGRGEGGGGGGGRGRRGVVAAKRWRKIPSRPRYRWDRSMIKYCYYYYYYHHHHHLPEPAHPPTSPLLVSPEKGESLSQLELACLLPFLLPSSLARLSDARKRVLRSARCELDGRWIMWRPGGRGGLARLD